MNFLKFIPPRHLILGLIVLIGLSLRLWGIAWGPPEAGALHPGEWTWQIIDSLSFSQPTFPGIWTQAFFSLAALLKGIAATLTGWVKVLLGEVHTTSEVFLSARAAGRFTVAFMGAGQVVLLYLVGRRFFDSVGTGLLAAAIAAVNPLLVANCHYLSLDIPLGFAVLCCLWVISHMLENPRAGLMFLAGLALGLTITTKASGVFVAPLVLGAYLWSVRQTHIPLSRRLFVWPLCLLLGVSAGLILGYPGFIIEAEQAQKVLESSLSLPPASASQWMSYATLRWKDSTSLLGGVVGLEIILLWWGGMVLLVWQRQWKCLLPALFPILYFAASLTLLTGSVEGLASVWLPVAALVACWPLIFLCRRIPGYRWPVAAACIIGVLLCIAPLWRSLGVGYLFWQEDTLSAARFWVEDNLPQNARILVGPRTPLNIFSTSQPLDQRLGWQKIMAPGRYVLVSSLGGLKGADAWSQGWKAPAAGMLSEMPEHLQLLKRFDLKYGKSGPGMEKKSAFPPWVSPLVEIYAALPKLELRQPLAVFRPAVGGARRSAVVYGDETAYSLGADVMILNSSATAQRFLRLKTAVSQLGLQLTNQGQELAVVEIVQGFWPRRRVSLYPGQEANLLLPARAWPPVVSGIYPVKLRLRRGDKVVARLHWDPLLLGRRALESGDFARAADILQNLVDRGAGGFDAYAMLAEAWARLGQYAKASWSLAALSGLGKESLSDYQGLAMSQTTGPQWDKRFSRLSGYHTKLLRRSCSLSYEVKGPPCLSEGEEISLKGTGYRGTYQRPAGQAGGHLKLWLTDPFPTGPLQASLDLRLKKSPAPTKNLLRVEVWSQRPKGSRRLASRVVYGHDLPNGSGTVKLPLMNSQPNASLQIRIFFLSAIDVRVDRLILGVDLQAHMRHILRWYFDAWGRVSLHTRRYAAAVDSFENLLSLDPMFKEAYLPLAQALLDTGKVERAYAIGHQAEKLFQSLPARLEEVRDLYQALQKTKDAARVDKRLAHLHPSLKREAQFAGGMTLLGYDLPQAQVKRGGKLNVNYYWQSWAHPPLNYFIFVHLRRPDKTLTFDHLLDHGQQPMTLLSVGQVVREDYSLKIPTDISPGKYRLVVGLWDPWFTRKGLPIINGASEGKEEVELATVEVR